MMKNKIKLNKVRAVYTNEIGRLVIFAQNRREMEA